MSGREVIVAVVSDGALRAYHRNGRELAQVAQLVVSHEVEPAVIATMMTDLGEALGWSPVGGRQVAAPASAKALPPARPRGRPRGRHAAASNATELAAILDLVQRQPGIKRSEVADQLGLDVGTVKRRTDALLARGVIDAQPLPGVRERGPGGGHGLFPMQPATEGAT